MSRYIEDQIINNRNIIKEKLINDLKKRKGLKINTVLNLILEADKDVGDGSYRTIILEENFYVSSVCDIIHNEDDINEFSSGEKIFKAVNECRFESSSIRIAGVREHYINVYKYTPLKGGSYIDLPKKFKNSSKGLINIISKDDKCFMWCHIAHLFPVPVSKNRVSKYRKHEKDVDYTGIKFLVTLDQINKKENLNEINFNIFK